ncbi:hypothetical protein PIB30_040914 [Stylosanthes scabra]|uniref:Uncharacterized protein n=1 Tax=Stylosanthes scabra TaxID=79078 RepID=A0ABU6WD63_9FABA|nr:hypothetical protein [Stylosanthes scabra]
MEMEMRWRRQDRASGYGSTTTEGCGEEVLLVEILLKLEIGVFVLLRSSSPFPKGFVRDVGGRVNGGVEAVGFSLLGSLGVRVSGFRV